MITEARDIYLYLLYLVGGIYQSGDLKLKSVKISVQGPFKWGGSTCSHFVVVVVSFSFLLLFFFFCLFVFSHLSICHFILVLHRPAITALVDWA